MIATRPIVRTLLMLGLVLTASPVRAQSHPCDQAAPVSQTIPAGVPHKLTFCQPSTDRAEAVIVMVDAQVFDLLPVTALTQPSATGLVLYETALFLNVESGQHQLVAATYNLNQATGARQVGPASPPFSFAALAETPLPSVPVIKGVAR